MTKDQRTKIMKDARENYWFKSEEMKPRNKASCSKSTESEEFIPKAKKTNLI